MGAPVRLMMVMVLLLVAAIEVRGAEKVCIVGSGIGGASASYFLQTYSTKPIETEIFERHGLVGGRLAQVQLGGDKFEAGGSIIANRNRHMRHFTELLGLTQSSDVGQDNFGIWNGGEIFFQTKRPGESYVSQKLTNIWNALLLLWRYGMSLQKMQSYVSELLENWDGLYGEELPVFETVKDMLEFVNLYDLTQDTLENNLLTRGLSPRLVDELITVIVRINYGQNVSISGLAGAVGLAGSGDELWHVKEGNWRVPDGLIKLSNASVHLNEEVLSVAQAGDGGSGYEVGLASGRTAGCDAVIIATPLDEVNISFTPGIEIPKRSLQHTYTTFVRGLIQSKYFGAASAEELPTLIGTVEDPSLQFTSISVLRSYSDEENAYKVFSRAALTDADLDRLFKTRSETIRIDWGAYPFYTAPEQFAPLVLDGKHLYYINAFESAASAMEASAVSSRNVVRLLLSRLSGESLSQVTSCDDDMEGAGEL